MDFATLKREVLADWRAQTDFRDKAEDDFHFEAGHQWSDTEARELEGVRQPMVFNRVATIISAVAGSEINNRTEVRYIPREIGDVKPNEVLTAGAQWFRDQADAEDEESQAFRDMLICGMGWTETFLDFEEDPEGRPAVQQVPVAEMCWDRHSHRKGLTDAARVARVRAVPNAQAREMFPGKELSEINCDWIRAQSQVKLHHQSLVGEEYRDQDGEEDDDGLVVTVQAQWRERKTYVQYVEPQTGEKAELTKAEWDKLGRAGVPTMLIPNREYSKWCWKQAFLGATGFLKENAPCEDAATFRAITGYWDPKDKRFTGLLKPMIDPQKFANRWMTQTLHIINTNSKGGVMYESDAVEDMASFEDSWAASDSATRVAPGALSNGKITPKPAPAIPVALMQLTEFAIVSIRDASGVNQELLGLRDADQAGVLEYQRRQASMNTLAHYFDSLRLYRKWQGRVMLYFLVKWIAPTGRLVRIQKEGLEQYVPLAIDDDTATFDVIVDDSPTAPNEKERTWAILSEMLPAFAEMIPPEMWPDILEHSPLPASLTDKFREVAEKMAQQPPQPDPKVMLAQAKVEETQMRMEAARQADERKAALDQQKMANERETAEIERDQMIMEGHFAQQEHMMKLRELSAELQATFAKIDADREAQAMKLQTQAASSSMQLDTQRQTSAIGVKSAKDMAAVKKKTAAKPKNPAR